MFMKNNIIFTIHVNFIKPVKRVNPPGINIHFMWYKGIVHVFV